MPVLAMVTWISGTVRALRMKKPYERSSTSFETPAKMKMHFLKLISRTEHKKPRPKAKRYEYLTFLLTPRWSWEPTEELTFAETPSLRKLKTTDAKDVAEETSV
mmetsp:Transcript_14155/g.27271  ORF Transcript_14155/g.27271 Transcript_14155/m.27271 type:complete len:104 (-) Transcript_14155:180-491(-)